jgi:hypothetical protein
MDTIKHVVTDAEMQEITDTTKKLVQLLRKAMPAFVADTTIEANNSLMHSIMGNAVMRVCQAISNDVAPVHLPVMMNACIQALGQYSAIATEMLDDVPQEKPNLH